MRIVSLDGRDLTQLHIEYLGNRGAAISQKRINSQQAALLTTDTGEDND
jgi:hypothetical protein